MGKRDIPEFRVDETMGAPPNLGHPSPIRRWDIPTRRPYHRPMFEKICNIGKPQAEGAACGFPPMPDYLVPPFFKSEYFKHEISDGQNEFIGEWLRFQYFGDERRFNLG